MADPNRPEDITSAAVKFDGDKTMYDLLPWDAIEEIGKLYTKGAKKYAARNWEKGFRWGRTFAAMTRHAISWFMAYVRGENGIDPETGLSHMVAVAWNAIALITFELRGTGIDDRPGAPEQAPKLSDLSGTPSVTHAPPHRWVPAVITPLTTVTPLPSTTTTAGAPVSIPAGAIINGSPATFVCPDSNAGGSPCN